VDENQGSDIYKSRNNRSSFLNKEHEKIHNLILWHRFFKHRDSSKTPQWIHEYFI